MSWTVHPIAGGSPDYLWAMRQGVQHLVFQVIFGQSLPGGVNPQQHGLRIADIACGTGIWTLEAARSLPEGHSAEVIGLDINIRHVPSPEWCPSSVSFREFDCLRPDDMDLDLVGSFDVVHARLLTFFPKGDPDIFLRTVSRLLKPGGQLVWQETTSAPEDLHVRTPSHLEGQLRATEEMWEVWRSANSGRAMTNPAYFENWDSRYNLRLTGREAKPVPSEYWRMLSHTQLEMLGSWINSAPVEKLQAATGRLDDPRRELQQLFIDAKTEWDKGATGTFEGFFEIRAQKL